MSKVTTLILLFFTYKCYSQVYSPNYEAFKTYYIIGDKVNLRPDTNLDSKVFIKLDFGMEFQGERVNKNWFYLDVGEEQGFVNIKYIANVNRFLKLAEAKAKNNGVTLISLEKIYKKAGQLDKAESVSIEIINNFKHKIFPTFLESCPLYGEEAFNTIVYDKYRLVKYQDPHLQNYLKRILTESKDSSITLWAMHLLARCYLKNNNEAQAKSLILRCFKDYHEYFVLPQVCGDYDMEGNYLFVEELKKTILWFHKDMFDEMRKICNDNKMSIIPKSVACDVLAKSKY